MNKSKPQRSVDSSYGEGKTTSVSSLQLKPLCRGEQKADRAGVMSGNEEEK